MGSVLLDVLPYALVAALPALYVAALTALILTHSKRPILGASVFTAGPLVLDAVLAAVVLTAFWGKGSQAAGGSTVSAWIDIVFASFCSPWGCRRCSTPRRRRSKQPRARGSRTQRWLVAGGVRDRPCDTQIIDMDALGILGAGLKEILIEPVPVWQAVVAVAFMLAIMLLPYYAPAVYFAIRRQRAAKGLGRVSDWLIAHTRALEIAAGLIIGLPFLAKGLAAL
jgi:hypothetical protein